MSAIGIGISPSFGGRPWTPNDLAGLALWLDPNDLNAVFKESAGTNIASAGDTVGLLSDKSGNARHFAQGTAANEPLLLASGTRRLIQFADSTDTLLGNAAAQAMTNAIAGFSIGFMVQMPAASASAKSLIRILGGGGGTRIQIYTDTSFVMAIQTRRLDADSTTTSGSGINLVASTKYSVICSVDYPTGAVRMNINGTNRIAATAAWTAGATTSATNSTVIELGSSALPYADGAVGPVIACTRTWTALEEQLVENYLAGYR